MAVAVGGSSLRVGGQDCHAEAAGAHTGDIAAAMLADAGASHVILGHSERRGDHGETSAEVAAKVRAAWQAGLTAIVCLGETEAERQAGATLEVVAAQLEHSLPRAATAANTVVAYEPVWAIGSGRTPSEDEIAQVHGFLRDQLPDREIRLLYGGSVKAENADAVFAVPGVDGALVGGASLKAADFGAIIAALARA
jgi:triosephosphate isomerase (TIM)